MNTRAGSNPPTRSTLRGASIALAALAMVVCTACSSPKRAPEQAERESIESHSLVVQAEQARAAGQDEEALRLLSQAIEENPTLTVAYMEMGEIYEVRGENAKAEQNYGAAASLEPTNFDAQYKHGYMLHILNRLSEAVSAYLRSLAIRPNDFNANLNLATAYFQLNEPSQALYYAETAVRLEPTSGPARVNLGAVYAAIGRHDDAVRQYEAASELMDLSPELLLNLAESLGKIGRHREMENTLNAVLELEASAAAWERIGFARFKQRDYSGAMAAFQEAVAIDDRHYPALNGLGVCLLNRYLKSERKDEAARKEAVRLLKRSLQINNRQNQIIELVSRFDS